MIDLNETFRAATKPERAIMVRKARVVGMIHGRVGSDSDAECAAKRYCTCSNLFYAYRDGVKQAEHAKARKLP